MDKKILSGLDQSIAVDIPSSVLVSVSTANQNLNRPLVYLSRSHQPNPRQYFKEQEGVLPIRSHCSHSRSSSRPQISHQERIRPSTYVRSVEGNPALRDNIQPVMGPLWCTNHCCMKVSPGGKPAG